MVRNLCFGSVALTRSSGGSLGMGRLGSDRMDVKWGVVGEIEREGFV